VDAIGNWTMPKMASLAFSFFLCVVFNKQDLIGNWLGETRLHQLCWGADGSCYQVLRSKRDSASSGIVRNEMGRMLAHNDQLLVTVPLPPCTSGYLWKYA
jgi:hypothetical protein